MIQRSKPIVIDMFSGAGGESAGICRAFREADQNIELHAINHWERAIETHSLNHPWAEHHLEPIQNLDPVRVVPGGRVAMLWASPECTHHSVARGGKPCSDQSRASAWLVLKWLQELYVERVIIENVPEFVNWGPLGADGRPMDSMKGATFRAWVAAMESLGYRVDWRVLNAADYGAPTTRRRLFVQAVRGHKRILWPDATHSQSPDLFGSRPWVPAADIIDWRIPGTSVFDRKKPLAEKTLKRIELGIEKYWGEHAEPFLLKLRGTGRTGRLSDPLPTVSAGGQHHALVCPIDHRSSEGGCRPACDPLSTVTTKQRHAVVQPIITEYHGSSADRCRELGQPLPTVDCSPRFGLIEPFMISYYGNGQAHSGRDPLPTVTCVDRYGMVSPRGVDLTLRMLRPHELAAAQSFPAGYQFAGNQRDQVKQIGNAVPPALSYAQMREYVGGGKCRG